MIDALVKPIILTPGINHGVQCIRSLVLAGGALLAFRDAITKAIELLVELLPNDFTANDELKRTAKFVPEFMDRVDRVSLG